MSNLRQAAQQALEALVTCCAEEWRTLNNFGMKQVYDEKKVNAAITALRAALAEPEQEPVALPCCGYANASAVKWNPHNQVVQCHNCGQIYTAPTPRKPLTDEQIVQVLGGVRESITGNVFLAFARAIERAHGIGEQK